jgi:hypothetical protein
MKQVINQRLYNLIVNKQENLWFHCGIDAQVDKINKNIFTQVTIL